MARKTPAIALSTAAIVLAGSGAALAQTYYPLPNPPRPNPPTPPAVVKKAPKSVSSKATPTRDARAPYKFKASGTISLPTGVTKAAGCKGTVILTLQRGSRQVGRTTTKLSSSCRYSKTVSVKRSAKLAKVRGRTKGSLKLGVRFNGNTLVKAKSASKKTVRYGPR